MTSWYILDDNGDPVPEPNMLKAARWFEDAGTNGLRTLALSEFENGVFLSTVFLSLDHNHWGQGEPVLYESMWFGGTHDGEQRRYCTKQEALEGHKEMLAEAGYECKFVVGRTPRMNAEGNLELQDKPWFIGLATLIGEQDGKDPAV